MEIYADVIQGSLRVVSNGGNGFSGQDGGRGVDAPDSTARVNINRNRLSKDYFCGLKITTNTGSFCEYRSTD